MFLVLITFEFVALFKSVIDDSKVVSEWRTHTRKKVCAMSCVWFS